MKLNSRLIACLSLGLIAAEPFDATRNSRGDDKLLVIMAENVFINEVERDPVTRRLNPTTGEEEILVSMDSEWNSRVRVIDVLHGHYDSDTLDFVAYDHYGQPGFSMETGHILLFVRDYDKGFVHSKYMYEPVFALEDGGFATCGNPFLYEDSIDPVFAKPDIEPMAFVNPVTFDLGEEQRQLEATYGLEVERLSPDDEAEMRKDLGAIEADYQPPVFERDEGRATCRMGIRAEDVVEYELNTTFRHRKIMEFCNRQHPDPFNGSYYLKDTQSERYKTWTTQKQACNDKLLASGWPYDMTGE